VKGVKIDMEIYEAIRKLHVQENMSQRSIASKLGISRNTVKKYINGGNVPWERKPYATSGGKVITPSVIAFINQCFDTDAIMNYRDKYLLTNRLPISNDQGEIIAAVSVFKNVTTQNELRSKIQELNSNNILLETIIDSVQEAISVVDEYGFFKIVNDAYSRVSGRSKEEVIGKPIASVVPEKEISIHRKVFHTHKPEMGIRYDFGVNHDTVVVHVSPLMVDGKFKGTVAVIHNIENVKQITTALDNAANVIDELNKGQAKYTFEGISCVSKMMKETIAVAKRVSKTPVTVLIRGESGTGKELLAHSIHNHSNRKKHRFISVNCAAIPYNLIESVLFGYKEGAFTGAIKGGHTGIFETCDKGTVFLDEIGELNMETQVKLLRVLQEKEIVKVGDTTPKSVNVRIIAATNANLEEMVFNNRFRKDLYYRLNVIPIHIPNLKERSQDIPGIVQEILRKKNTLLDANIKGISDKAIKKLMLYSWPGNIRELENIITRSMLSCNENEEMISEDCIPFLTNPLDDTNITNCDNTEYNGESYRYLFENWERDLIKNVMLHYEGNKKKAAESLQISLKSLYNKLNYYKI
jgi:PAS domain S-box-containing protein